MLLVAANQVVGLELDVHSHSDLVVVSPLQHRELES
jgi:hypothetical protein